MNYLDFPNDLTENNLEILQSDPTRVIEMIMDQYGEEIKRLVFTYVKNTADADDVTQEVFLTVYRKLHTFQGKSSIRSWIYSIAINKSKDYLRSWKVRNDKLRDKLINFNQVARTTETVEDSFEQSVSNELLERVLSLPVKYREVIILFYFKDLTVVEIGNSLELKQTTVRTRLNRGRDRLKNLLDLAERGENIG
ncbi:sigma-70 family RNA polymerase sigma factor [Aquibacillus halophilus]|uniref:RNA polymerase sigma factor n=1 Tax=Aquibacillus halophilus TaxID=930132 RepID=A0A6A8DDF7_9BACI|nr:sigma-70 family RNA polymerase sigma factor [Aquibacillus halophilus]MRH41801.1 sigma-70 family RNA polymerase sigma factor [Aquibacillus halophilus]